MSFGMFSPGDFSGLPVGGWGSRANRVFTNHYKCYSVAMMEGRGGERDEINYGGKIILPPSALARLTALDISYPMFFEISSVNGEIKTYAGVLEFIAEEGRCYMPNWMMQTLGFDQGDIAKIKSTELEKGTFVKIQPQTVDFLEISDPKAVLEQAFRSFSTLHKGDIIQILYNCITFDIQILEVKPEGCEAISILETDLEVDFAPPVGYVEPEAPKRQVPTMASKMNIDIDQKQVVSGSSGTKTGFVAFQGSGQSLNGKAKAKEADAVSIASSIEMSARKPQNILSDSTNRLVPAALNLPFGQLFFGYKYKPFKTAEEKESEAMQAKKSLRGQGHVLKPSRRNMSATVGTSQNTARQEHPKPNFHPSGPSTQRLGINSASSALRSSANTMDVTDVIRIEDDDDYISIDSDSEGDQRFSDAEEEL